MLLEDLRSGDDVRGTGGGRAVPCCLRAIERCATGSGGEPAGPRTPCVHPPPPLPDLHGLHREALLRALKLLEGQGKVK